jgi:hypothetical protein
MAENWNFWSDAIQRIRTVTDPPYSVGAAEAALKGAIASGQVRVRRVGGVFSGPGRGLVKVDNQWVDVASRMDANLVSDDDLEFWLKHILAADTPEHPTRGTGGQAAKSKPSVKRQSQKMVKKIKGEYETYCSETGERPSKGRWEKFSRGRLGQDQAREVWPAERGRPPGT